jgi:NAD(P)-dependent dehydrogenase (short-subunit alcohol dehydrogenase family)
MTIALARELARYGVRCNAVAPLAYTGMTRSLWGTEIFPDERPAELEPGNVAAVVGWLAAPESAPVTEKVFAVTGS